MPTERRGPRTLPFPTVGSPPSPIVPEPERFTLENGLRVVTARRGALPQIAARLVVAAGSAADPTGAPGAASLVGALLTEGTGALSAVELNDRIDGLGASLCARVGHDFAEIDLSLLAETLREGLELFAGVVTDPAFPSREIERVRAETLDALDARLDEPGNVADDETAALVFGPDHPYGRLPLGSVEGVEGLGREELVEFHRSRYRPDGSVLVMAGDFGSADLRDLLENTFGSWTGRSAPITYPANPERPRQAGGLSTIERAEAAQAEIRVAGPGIARSSADWIPAAVANYILGGSTITGRLGANLREDKGWTYGVRSGFAAGVQPGGWVIDAAVDAGVVAAALEEIDAELSRIVSDPVDEDDLDRAREALILSLPRAFETAGRTVARLATLEAFGLPPDYWQLFPRHVAAVTGDDVLRVATQHFAPDAVVRVAVGPSAS